MVVLKWRQLTETNGPTNYNIIVAAPADGMWNGGRRRHLPDASDASADTPESAHYSGCIRHVLILILIPTDLFPRDSSRPISLPPAHLPTSSQSSCKLPPPPPKHPESCGIIRNNGGGRKSIRRPISLISISRSMGGASDSARSEARQDTKPKAAAAAASAISGRRGTLNQPAANGG